MLLEASDLNPPAEESEKFVFGLPTLGVALDFNPHRMLNIYAQGSGMYAGSYGYLYDAEIGIKLIPIKILSIVGGIESCSLRPSMMTTLLKQSFMAPLLA